MPTRTPARTGRTSTSTGRFGRTTSTPTGRFGRTPTQSPAGRFGSVPRRRQGTPTTHSLARRRKQQPSGLAGLTSKLPGLISGGSTKSKGRGKAPMFAALAGLGGVAAAFAKRKSGAKAPEPPTYAPPAEPTAPATPVGAGNGTSSQ